MRLRFYFAPSLGAGLVMSMAMAMAQTSSPSPKPSTDSLSDPTPTNDPLFEPTPKPTAAVTTATTTTSTNYRRKDILCEASPDAAEANCEKDLQLKVFCDFPSYTFKSDERACVTGKRFVGSSGDGKLSITLVPGRRGDGTFAAFISDRNTGGVYSINPNVDGIMTVVESMQEDFGDEEDHPDDYESISNNNCGNDSTRALRGGFVDNNGAKTFDFLVEEKIATVEDGDNGSKPIDMSGGEMVPMQFLEKEGAQSHRNLLQLSCSITSSSSIKCSWDCKRGAKDTVCWKKQSDSGSPCRTGPGNYVYNVPSGGSKKKTCTYEITNLQCQTYYNVRIRKNSGITINLRGLKTDSCVIVTPPKETIDVLVLWTRAAECRNSDLGIQCTPTATTTTDMLTQVDKLLAITNAAFDNSGVFAEVNLAHGQLIPSYIDVKYPRLSVCKSLLNQVTIDPYVNLLRDKYNADVVSLVISDRVLGTKSGRCGIGWLGPARRLMFSVVSFDWAEWNFSFAHEIGHNLGCKHNRGAQGSLACIGKIFKYNYGYRDPDADFSSIMAERCKYSCFLDETEGNCHRGQFFSNIEYDDVVTGKAMGNKENNNARQINDVAKKVAAYYPKPTCMAGNTGFMKVTGAVTPQTTQLQDLQLGDFLIGLDRYKSVVTDCEVISLTSKGNATVYDKYTSDHYIVDGSGSTLITHGDTGQQEDNVPVFQVLTSCPVVTDDSGKDSTFSICGKALYENGDMPWNDYLVIHESMFKIVKATDIRSLCAFHNIDDAIDHLPLLCTTMFTCVNAGECEEFEAGMLDFVNSELILDARQKVFSAFPQIGQPSVEGSISYMISEGKSKWGWYPDYYFERCKRDGDHMPYFEKNGWLQPTRDSCCASHFSWAYNVCMNEGEALGPSNKFFVDFATSRCIQDCVAGTGQFGCSPVPPPIALYDSIEDCCEMGQSWVNIDYCYSRSINGYSDGWVVDYVGLKLDCHSTKKLFWGWFVLSSFSRA